MLRRVRGDLRHDVSRSNTAGGQMLQYEALKKKVRMGR